MKKLRNYSLGIVLASLWILCWAGQWFLEVVVDSNAPDAAPVVQWAAHTLENDQSEFLQLFSFVVLTTYFIYKGSHESKDSEERLEAKVDVLLRRSPNVVSVDVSGEELSKEVARQLSQEIARELRKQGRSF